MKSTLTLPLVMLFFVGCNAPEEAVEETSEGADVVIVMDDLPPLLDEHAEHGPHEGELVELGKGAFHAELLHASDGVTVYVLDGLASETVSIEADKLTISLKLDGKVHSFELAANPQPGDLPGNSARFSSSDSQLEQWIDSGAVGVVVVTIKGRSYTGEIAHDHNHEH